MNCETLDSILDDHRIDSLNAAEKGTVAAHLEHCARCAGAWLVNQTLAAEAPPGPRPGLLQASLRRATRQPAPARPANAQRWTAAASIAAVVALAAIGVFAFQAERNAAPPAAANAQADAGGRFMAGVHYQRIGPPAAAAAANEADVIQFFMYGCFPCYSFEPALGRWVSALPSGVQFERVPALFNPLAALHARAFYTAAALGKLDELHGAMFEEIHRNGNALDTPEELATLFARFGVERDAFDRAFGSPAVQLQLIRAADLNRTYRPQGTPALVIDGTYVTSPAMTNSYPVMLAVADQLLAEGEPRSRCNARTTCEGAGP
jgi:thiol:disulfide interchange protein DsbA